MTAELFKDPFHFLPAAKKNLKGMVCLKTTRLHSSWVVAGHVSHLKNLFVITSLQHSCLQLQYFSFNLWTKVLFRITSNFIEGMLFESL
jgi:hypothetical protein